jgi:hypothetical protein
MPLIEFHILKGRSREEIATLLDASHRAVVAALGVPQRDRYQIVHEHPAAHFIVEDTGLDIPRSKDVVLIKIISRPRGEATKLKLYEELCRELNVACDIAPSDVMVSITINSDADWSFGNGRAQFITGEL